ncbi:MAG TPA: hypothetical protein DEQ09_11910 [Bacteroidales bacterium]|nr:hypothetical protein [Bacteroidales bacterium]
MRIDSIVPGKFVKSSIWFRSEDNKPATVTWDFEEINGKTMVTWTMLMKSTNPFLRVMNQMFKGSLKKSFTKGLANMKSYLEEKGVSMSELVDINIKDFPAMKVLVAELKIVQFEVFKGISGMHLGSYDDFESSYNKLMEEARARNFELTWEAWEFYYTDPETEPDQSKWKTEIVFPVIKPE